jgi:hypothetical protein
VGYGEFSADYRLCHYAKADLNLCVWLLHLLPATISLA